MATKWSADIDAVPASQRAKVAELCKAGLEYEWTDEDGRKHKQPSCQPLRDGGFERLASQAETNAASRGKSVAHSLNVIIARLAAPAAGASIAARVVSLEKAVEKLLNERA